MQRAQGRQKCRLKKIIATEAQIALKPLALHRFYSVLQFLSGKQSIAAGEPTALLRRCVVARKQIATAESICQNGESILFLQATRKL
jgi:hypothetical protein